MSTNPHQILRRALLTEKSHTDNEAFNKYTFEVRFDASKGQIKDAVEKIFPGVAVKKVNTMPVRGKRRRVRYRYGYTSKWKKAIITIGKGEKIELFENQ